jgi:putative addiction module component (TIGR02574 family)
MTTEHQAVFHTALTLPEPERVLLVERLLESLSPEPDELTDDEFYAELERRRAEVEADPTSAIPWTDVLKE